MTKEEQVYQLINSKASSREVSIGLAIGGNNIPFMYGCHSMLNEIRKIYGRSPLSDDMIQHTIGEIQSEILVDMPFNPLHPDDIDKFFSCLPARFRTYPRISCARSCPS